MKKFEEKKKLEYNKKIKLKKSLDSTLAFYLRTS